MVVVVAEGVRWEMPSARSGYAEAHTVCDWREEAALSAAGVDTAQPSSRV